jgi:hypothetical protein
VRPVAVVVLDIDPEHALELTAAENQEPVETLTLQGADEALGVGVRPLGRGWAVCRGRSGLSFLIG